VRPHYNWLNVFPVNLIHFNLSQFDVIFGIDSLTTDGENIDYKNLNVTLKRQKDRVACICSKESRNEFPIICTIKAGFIGYLCCHRGYIGYLCYDLV